MAVLCCTTVRHSITSGVAHLGKRNITFKTLRPKAVQEQCEKLRRLYGEAEFKSILGDNFATIDHKDKRRHVKIIFDLSQACAIVIQNPFESGKCFRKPSESMSPVLGSFWCLPRNVGQHPPQQWFAGGWYQMLQFCQMIVMSHESDIYFKQIILYSIRFCQKLTST